MSDDSDFAHIEYRYLLSPDEAAAVRGLSPARRRAVLKRRCQELLAQREREGQQWYLDWLRADWLRATRRWLEGE